MTLAARRLLRFPMAAVNVAGDPVDTAVLDTAVLQVSILLILYKYDVGALTAKKALANVSTAEDRKMATDAVNAAMRDTAIILVPRNLALCTLSNT